MMAFALRTYPFKIKLRPFSSNFKLDVFFLHLSSFTPLCPGASPSCSRAFIFLYLKKLEEAST